MGVVWSWNLNQKKIRPNRNILSWMQWTWDRKIKHKLAELLRNYKINLFYLLDPFPERSMGNAKEWSIGDLVQISAIRVL